MSKELIVMNFIKLTHSMARGVSGSDTKPEVICHKDVVTIYWYKPFRRPTGEIAYDMTIDYEVKGLELEDSVELARILLNYINHQYSHLPERGKGQVIGMWKKVPTKML